MPVVYGRVALVGATGGPELVQWDFRRTAQPALLQPGSALRATQGTLDAAVYPQRGVRRIFLGTTSPQMPVHGPLLNACVPLPSQVAGLTRATLHRTLAGLGKYDLSLPLPLLIASLGTCIHESAMRFPVPSSTIELPLPSSPITIHAAAYTGGSRGLSTFVTVGDVLQALCKNRQHLAIGYEGQGEGGVTRPVPSDTPGASEYAGVGVGYPVQRSGDSQDRKMMFAGLVSSSLGTEVYTLHIIA